MDIDILKLAAVNMATMNFHRQNENITFENSTYDDDLKIKIQENLKWLIALNLALTDPAPTK